MVWLSRRLCGLDDVIEYRDVVSNFGINDCCGGENMKKEGRKEQELVHTMRDQEGAT